MFSPKNKSTTCSFPSSSPVSQLLSFRAAKNRPRRVGYIQYKVHRAQVCLCRETHRIGFSVTIKIRKKKKRQSNVKMKQCLFIPRTALTCHVFFGHLFYIYVCNCIVVCVYIYIPGTQLTLVLIRISALFWGVG